MVQVAEQNMPDVVVLTAWLEGNMDIIDVVYQLRCLDIRVVFITDTLTKEDLTVKRFLELSVYDILFGEIRIGQVLEKIFNPGQSLNGLSLSGNKEERSVEHIDAGREQEKETPFSRLVKIGGDIRKNIPSVAVSKTVATKVLEKVVSVYSPVPAGKTFVAVNLATVIAQEGYNVALVDADYKKFSVHTWLKCPDGEDGLSRAINDCKDPMLYAYQPSYIPGLYVFTNDPGKDAPLISDRNLVSLMESLQAHVDVIILDTPGDNSTPISRAAINLSNILMVVTDPDFSHLLSIQKVIDKLPDEFDFDKCVIIANQLIDSDKILPDDAEKATGMKVACIIPSNPRLVLESIKIGLPVVMFDKNTKEVFEELVFSELA